jgi:hypothetical protein
MRILVASLLLAVACGGPQTKKQSDGLESAEVPGPCCCKTIPETAEKEIVPVYAMTGRMECSTKHGDCVDNVQCNGSQQAPQPGDTGTPAAPQPTDTGVPPPPSIPSSGDSSGSSGE